jgi:hypothetical protein
MGILGNSAVLLSLLAILAGPAWADPVWTSDMPRTSADPAADAVADNEGACSGAPSVDPGFARMADVDGDGVNDLLLDYGRLRCDEGTRYCGTAGCRLDVWLSGPQGDWRLVLRDRVEDAYVPMPGVLVTWLDAGYCDTPRVCFRAYDAWGGTLRRLEPGPEVYPAP